MLSSQSCRGRRPGHHGLPPAHPGGGRRLVVVVVIDFLLLTQANHTIYDYGSFGFWGAVLAGGATMLADGYR